MSAQMQPINSAAATATFYDNPGGGSLNNAGSMVDTGDAVMARWLQSTGLQHLASPISASGVDNSLLPNLLNQGHGTQSIEEKQRLLKLLRSMDMTGESDSYAPTARISETASDVDCFFSSELRGEFGAGLLDLHAMDDTELLSEHDMPESFEASPFMPLVPDKMFDNESDGIINRQQIDQAEASSLLNEKEKIDRESSTKESSVAKIKVVVRKRPLNKKEISRKEEDIVTVSENALTVHEPRLKVDLTAYVEKHEFCFDAVLNERVTNDEVYRITVAPIIPTIFQRTKATCFAYGQTGSGKTFTMQPLPLKAAEDIVRLLHQPFYHNQKFKLWLSYFEIYGGKLFDLLSERKKLCMREDGRQQVCIVGLQEFEVSDVQIVKDFIEKGNAARSTGTTGANEESSRSHAILQLAIKKHKDGTESRRQNDGNESKGGKIIGKISFIDLAGSERGADTTDNDRQTRIEGAEINKSLLALKECIRALDNDQIHIPFRGSKLTEVLRDSFVGNSRTVMISCISPNAGSCEHTLNTLRYADRVKSLSRSGNAKRDQAPVLISKEASTSMSFSFEQGELSDLPEEKIIDISRKIGESLAQSQVAASPSGYNYNAREEGGLVAVPNERERVEKKTSTVACQKLCTENSIDRADEETISKVSPPRRKAYKEEKLEKQGNLPKRETGSDLAYASKQQYVRESSLNHAAFRQCESQNFCDGEMNAILEEKEALTTAHRKEIEETMDIVREEMKLLAEVEHPGSVIDNYVSQLSFVLSRKAAGLVSLQARLARFQHRLKEQEILSRKKVPR